MPGFAHSALLVGLWIVAIPVVIHLINMLRHRPVDWAAMEFLLTSQKKNRTWIVMKQLLLLLLRMLAIAAVVLVVAQPLLHNQFGNLFGSTKTHHIVLLDDSFSMSDRWADRSAFGEAKQVIQRIGAESARQVQPQTFTLLRFSRISHVAGRTQADLLGVPVSSDFDKRLGDILEQIEVSQASAGPMHALAAVDDWLGAEDERQIVYLISDFRTREWNEPTELHRQLLQLSERKAEIHLINCVDRTRPNLAITSLAAAEGIRAADVPWLMEVTVQNFGATTAKDVPVLLEEDGHARSAVTIAEIPPGRAVTERFPVRFPTAGEHRITARLEIDAVAVDNFRFSTIDLPTDVPVLLIDNPDARDAQYLSIASAPGGPVRTGIRPQIETPGYLSREPLDGFHAINLLNVERLDPPAIDALEEYIAAGGGVAIFLGERCRGKFINDELYRDAAGFFPLPLAGPADLLIDRLRRAPDLQVASHSIFRILAGKRNSFLSMVIVGRYFAVQDDWRPDPDSTIRVIARLRNGAPLAVERRFGKGRVVAFLTTAGPAWNNWARNPSFVVAIQDLQAYLSRRPMIAPSRPLGATLELELDPRKYQRRVRFDKLTENTPAAPAGDEHTAPTGNEQGVSTAFIDAVPTPEGSLVVSFSDAHTSGFYQAGLTTANGTEEKRLFAINVDAAEGDLEAVSGSHLATRLKGVDYRYRQASAFQYSVSELAGYNVSEWLLYLLVVLLIGEQILAWSASYHPPTASRNNPGGGRSRGVAGGGAQ